MSIKSNISCEFCPYLNYDYIIKASCFDEKTNDGISVEAITNHGYGCNKTGGNKRSLVEYYCGDAVLSMNIDACISFEESDKTKHRKRRQRAAKYKNKLKRQSIDIQSYPGVAYPVDKHGNYTEDTAEAAYYKKIRKSKKTERYGYYKKMSNDAVHNHLGLIVIKPKGEHTLFMSEDADETADVSEYDKRWNMLSSIDEDLRYTFGRSKGAYKKVYEYAWAVD